MLTLLYAIGGALLAVVLAWFGGRVTGKAKGKDEQIQKNTAEVIVKAEAEKEAKAKSDEITKSIDTEISRSGPGSSNDWLRKNANRDSSDKRL